MYSKTYYATSPRALHSATNEDLREQYLIDNLFSAGEIRLNYLHYERFVIGGGVSMAAAVFEPALRRHMAERVYASDLRAQPEIRFAELGERAGAIGAALYGAR